MFDARLLSVFREVATRGSFSDAATALSFTQPAISQQIARLERQLGTRLLVRDARGVTLTPAGEILLRHAETVLAQLRLAEAEVLAVTGVERPRLRVGAFPSAAASIMPPALAELRASHPETDVAMRVVEDAEALDALRRGELDVAMVLDSELMPLELPAGIEAVHVLDDPLLIALPYSHPLAARSAISLADLRDEEWMVCGVGGTCIDSNVVLRACDAAGFEPRITFETEDYSAIMGMVASGMGVALIPSLALVSAREDIAIRPLRDARPVRRVRAAVRRRSPQRAGRCAAGGPAPGRARAPVGGTAARRRRRLTLRLPRGAAPRPARRRRPAARERPGARRATARAAARRSTAVCSNGSAITAPVSIEVAASRRPSTSATKSSPLGMRARVQRGEALERRQVGGGGVADGHGRQGDVAPAGTALRVRRASSTRDRDSERSRWSLNMVTFWAATALRTSGGWCGFGPYGP